MCVLCMWSLLCMFVGVYVCGVYICIRCVYMCVVSHLGGYVCVVLV